MESNAFLPEAGTVIPESNAYEERAREISEMLSWPVRFAADCPKDDGPALKIGEGGLSLVDGDLCIKGDFSKLKRRIKKECIGGEYLVKAAKGRQKSISEVERPKIVDATAGLGEDSFLLAAAGFEMTLIEYDPVIFILLKDALERASQDPEISEIVSRMTLINGDSTELLRDLAFKPYAVYLDPMFPERKKSASVKKKFQVIHKLELPCDTEEKLLDAALAAKPSKVIIKRPAKGPFLAGRVPSYSIEGKAVRFDCIAGTQKE